MTKLKILPLAVQESEEPLFKRAGGQIEQLIRSEDYLFTEENPDVLYFITGGTERMAMQAVSKGHFNVLIGSQYNNSYASATEVKAYLNEQKIPSILLDEEEEEAKLILNDFLKVKKAKQTLNGKKLGLIGQVSDWLIASEIPKDILSEKLGIGLDVIQWNELAHFSEFKTSDSFMADFSGVTKIDLSETAKVNELLIQTIKNRKLDAVTVECFPMVMKDCVTACLPLAKLNNDGIPAGCEGDLTAIAGMMLCKELTGTVPWMANVNKVTSEVCKFSHCTIAPKLVSDYTVKTHFETNMGTAIQGSFKNDLVTIFRFDRHLQKAFVATANVTDRPKSPSACRTQIEVKLKENEVKLLREQPLGNHHLIYPGDCKNVLELACKVLGIEVLE